MISFPKAWLLGHSFPSARKAVVSPAPQIIFHCVCSAFMVSSAQLSSPQHTRRSNKQANFSGYPAQPKTDQEWFLSHVFWWFTEHGKKCLPAEVIWISIRFFYLLNLMVVLLLCSLASTGQTGMLEINEERWRQGKFNNGIPKHIHHRTYLQYSTSSCQKVCLWFLIS